MARVDILLPVYNMARFISKSLESISLQNFHDWRVLLVDDGSSDDSLEIAERVIPKAKLEVIKLSKNVGLSKALNIGLKAVDAEFIARLDPDDVCSSQRLKFQVDFLTTNSDVIGTSSPVISIDENDRLTHKFSWSELKPNEVDALLPVCNVINHPTVMMRFSDIAEMNFEYLEDPAQDYLTWLAHHGSLRWEVTKEPLVYWRKHNSNLSNQGYSYSDLHLNFRKNAFQNLGITCSEALVQQLSDFTLIQSSRDVKNLKDLAIEIKRLSPSKKYHVQVNRAFDTIFFKSSGNFSPISRPYILSQMHTSTVWPELKRRSKRKWKRNKL